MNTQCTPFQEKVYAVVRKIPKGETLTYNEVARMIESAPRAVGQALKRNPYKDVPCHRVVHADGRVGGYFGMPYSQEKARKLVLEGVKIKDGMIVRY